MANIKTITLGGAEQEVIISGQNCDIRNDGAEIIYASAQPNVTAGEDGVLAIPVGQAAKLLDSRGKVYLKGTGIAQICGNDYSELVFKSAPAGGGSGGTQDDIARNMASANAASISALRDDVTDVQSVAGSVSNENLLINPDFKINQREQSTYTAVGYTVDGWRVTSQNTSVTVVDGGIYLTNRETTPTHAKSLVQYVENFSDYRGKSLTFSVSAETMPGTTCNIIISDGTGTKSASIVDGKAQVTKQISDNATEIRVIVQLTSTSAGRAELYNAKLEVGCVATPYVPGNPAAELAKCQRYLLRLAPGSAYRTTSSHFEGFDFAVPTPTTMRNIAAPTIIGENNLEVQDWATMVSTSGFTYTVQALADNQLIIRATHANKPFTDAVLNVYNGAVLISAEL